MSRRLARAAVGRDVAHRAEIHVSSERHGSEYGGWIIHPDSLSADAVIYSFGIGTDVSFDLSMIAKFGVIVHAFDPTPRSVAWVESQSLPAAFIFHRLGIADFDGKATFRAPPRPDFSSYTLVPESRDSENMVVAEVRRLVSIMDQLGHGRIDVLKLDVEGAEYGVIEDLLSAELDITQLLVEFHHGFETVGIEKTTQAVARLRESGYKLFYVSPRGEEYSFLRNDGK